MARGDNDTWDPAVSVGATATMVATARAAASRDPASVVKDPFAEPLVRAVGVDFFTRLAKGELDFEEVGGSVGTGWMPEAFAARAKFYDDFFAEAGDRGVRQFVIVASGLDSRSYRLTWPAGTTVYEIDQLEVIEFKSRTFSNLGAIPTAGLRPVGIDLRRDWRVALQQAGFEPEKPTAWSAEGLLIGYLPGDAQDRLVDDITALSARGSVLAADHLPSRAASLGPQMQEITDQWKTHGSDFEIGNLTFSGDHHDIDNYLRLHGWAVTCSSLSDLFDAAGLDPHKSGATAGLISEIEYVKAIRT
jgi:methyltransferase (TIGR00027 family)